MYISQIRLKGFRNYNDATINLVKKSLIIGANEVGKSNLLRAVRLLLDKSYSLLDLEPNEDDFYAHKTTTSLEITLYFDDVNEECVLSKMREHIGDDSKLCLRYVADKQTYSYKLFAGRDDKNLTNIETRFYLKVLNFQYIGSKRDLFDYIRRERKDLLQNAKQERNDKEKKEDNVLLGKIETSLGSIDESVRNLAYVQKATNQLNEELKKLSIKNMDQSVIFDTGASDPSQFVDNLRLATKTQNSILSIGGDGRNSQIQLALWSSKHRSTNTIPEEVVLFGIEEPETHLHPHQQRKLAQYLSESLPSQVLITTHSSQIICAFPPKSVIRLYDARPGTLAASDGHNQLVTNTFLQFGHRLNVISSEAFFADLVFLVEGPSELLFYKALAIENKLDLDRYNISVISVDGVGFEPYVALLQALNIRLIIRTDNDIFKVPHQTDKYRYAGIQRALSIYRNFFPPDPDFDKTITDNEDSLSGFSFPVPTANIDSAHLISSVLETKDIFISVKDLEHDLYDLLPAPLQKFWETTTREETIKAMQANKAAAMFQFLLDHKTELSKLNDADIAKPLLRCKTLVEQK